MRLKIFLSFLAIAFLVVSCFLPWMTIESKAITITGVDTGTTTYGKPGYFHFIWAGLFLLFLLVKKSWATWVILIAAAFNLAWAFRNFLMLPTCGGGECPVRREGLYLLIAASVAMFVVSLLRSNVAPRQP